MNRMTMSPAASAVVRALIGRARASRDRILLTEIESVEWQSLTFAGERHRIQLRIPEPDATVLAERMCDGLEEAEFSIPGVIVADIALANAPKLALDGSISLSIEALTVTAD